MSEAANKPKTDASGTAGHPPATPVAAVSEATPPTICPETRLPCDQQPQCQLRQLKSVYCVRWVRRQQAEGLAALKGEVK